MIYACSRETAEEITVQTLLGNVKRALKQIVEVLAVDFSKTPSRHFQVWKTERTGQILQNAGAPARQSTSLSAGAQRGYRAHCRHAISIRSPEAAGLCRDLCESPPKWLGWGGGSRCSRWRGLARGAVLLSGLHSYVVKVTANPGIISVSSDLGQRLNDFHPVRYKSTLCAKL